MKVIVCGAGRVGQGIARRLAADGHNVTVIDADADLVDAVTGELEVQGVTGHAAYPDVLRQAGATDADMIVAVTHSDEVNMVTCQVAHVLFQIQTKIARIRAQAYRNKQSGDLFGRDGLAVDELISPEKAVADSIFQRLETPGAFFSTPFANKKIRCVGLEISENTPLARTTLSQIGELFPGLHLQVLGIVRNNHLFAASQSDQLMPGDRAYIVLETSQIERLSELLALEGGVDQRIVIIGAGNIGQYVAEQLEKKRGRKVRLIESNLNRAEQVAAMLSRSIVIHGEGLNPSILEEAGVPNADAVIGLSNDDNVNLLAASMCKKLGCKKTIALVNNPELSLVHEALGIDVVIDPRAVTISKVLLRLRKGRILSLNSLHDGEGEIAEGEVLEHSPLLESNLLEGSLPEGIVAAAVMRGEDILFPKKDLKVATGDHVILFYERSKTRKVEQLFRASSAYFLT
jgi:trk system potassium uptake protein TrkA